MSRNTSNTRPFEGAVLQIHPSGPSDGANGSVARAGGGETVIRKMIASLRERAIPVATLHALDESANGLRHSGGDFQESKPISFDGVPGLLAQVINVGWSIDNTQQNGAEDTVAKTKAALHQIFDAHGNPAAFHAHNLHHPVVKEMMQAITEVGRERGIGVVHQAHNIWGESPQFDSSYYPEADASSWRAALKTAKPRASKRSSRQSDKCQSTKTSKSSCAMRWNPTTRYQHDAKNLRS